MSSVCQSCGKNIGPGDDMVEVRYGKMVATNKLDKLKPKRTDHFHKHCTVAIADHWKQWSTL